MQKSALLKFKGPFEVELTRVPGWRIRENDGSYYLPDVSFRKAQNGPLGVFSCQSPERGRHRSRYL